VDLVGVNADDFSDEEGGFEIGFGGSGEEAISDPSIN